uniref:hypothetical protein n=1 Tax=Cecembia sp. TaxID=1898110 RepID=UPI0025C5E32A
LLFGFFIQETFDLSTINYLPKLGILELKKLYNSNIYFYLSHIFWVDFLKQICFFSMGFKRMVLKHFL